MQVKARPLIFASLILLSGIAFSESPSHQRVEQQLGAEVFVKEIAPGVWLHRSTSELGAFGRVESNGVIVVGQKGSVLIDTPATVPQTEHILDWAARFLHRPVRHAIFTHAHTDRIGGIDAVLARGIQTYALPRTIALARRDGLSLPGTALAEDAPLQLDGVALQVFYPGAGHTSDNIVVWLPRTAVLFGGCFVKAVSSQTLGNTAEADVRSWERGTTGLKRRYQSAKIVIPGHGALGGPELLEHTLHLLQASLKSTAASGAGGGL